MTRDLWNSSLFENSVGAGVDTQNCEQQRPAIINQLKEAQLNDNDNSPTGDLLLGAPRIAAFLGIQQRQVYRLADEGVLPTFRVGGTVSARRSSLAAWLAEQERAA